MKINFKHISYDDNHNNIVDKINLNFDQNLFSGIGFAGDIGPVGTRGITGPIGKKGFRGATGEAGSTWYRQNDAPTGSSIKQYDYWINTSAGSTGSGYVYSYDGSSWIFTGETFSKGSIFDLYQEIDGPGNINSQNAIISSNYIDPWKDTMVLSDYPLDASNINPNYSKLRIATDGEASWGTELPLFTLSKLNYSDTQPPSIYWRTGSPLDHGIHYKTSSDLRLEAGGDLSLLAGAQNVLAGDAPGEISINLPGQMTVNTSGNIDLKSSGQAFTDIAVESSFGSGFNIKSENFIIDASLSDFQRGLSINSFNTTNSGFNPRIELNSQISNSPIMETNSYSLSDLSTGTSSVVLEDFRNSEQIAGRGSFRTELVRIDPSSRNINLGYIKNGYPGATGAYQVRSTQDVFTQYSSKTISGVAYSYINLQNSSYYTDRGISIVTNNTNSSVPDPNTVWLQIKVGNSKASTGIWESDSINSYRFYYKGNGTSTLNTNYKFGGIIYRSPLAFSDSVVTFSTPVQTFELEYYGIGALVFYRTINDSGVLDVGTLQSPQVNLGLSF